MTPTLSICIPTRNRSSFLENALNCIVRDEVFSTTSEVEIVISDNCSEDETPQVAQRFMTKYPGKIRYYRNEQDLKDKNFELALSRGNGLFLKLSNDNLCFEVGALAKMVAFIKSQAEEKPLLFFLNGNTDSNEEVTLCNSVDETISHVSYYTTWIGGFGLWKRDFDNISDFSKFAAKNLAQTEVFMRLLLEKKKAAIYNPRFLEKGHRVYGKTGYNAAEVFGKNYLSILRGVMTTDGLTPRVFEQEKKRIYLEHIIPIYFDFQKLQRLDKGHYWAHTADYHKNLYFWLSFPGIIRKMLTPYRLIWRGKVFVYTYLFKNDKKASKYRRKLI